MRLYTIDLDYMKLTVQKKTAIDQRVKNRFKVRQAREVRKNEKWSEDYHVWSIFDTDEDIVAMRSTYLPEFFQRFGMAYRNYEAGEWMVSRDMLFTCHYMPKARVAAIPKEMEHESMWPEDGPTVTLLSFMREHGYQPPLNWP